MHSRATTPRSKLSHTSYFRWEEEEVEIDRKNGPCRKCLAIVQRLHDKVADPLLIGCTRKFAAKMSFSVKAKCPFLSRVSFDFVRRSGNSLGMYGQRCPVMSRLFTSTTSGLKGANGRTLSLGKSAA